MTRILILIFARGYERVLSFSYLWTPTRRSQIFFFLVFCISSHLIMVEFFRLAEVDDTNVKTTTRTNQLCYFFSLSLLTY